MSKRAFLILVALAVVAAGFTALWVNSRSREGFFAAYLEGVVLPDLYEKLGRWPTNEEIVARVREEREPRAIAVVERHNPILLTTRSSPTEFEGTVTFRHLFGITLPIRTVPKTGYYRAPE